MFSGQNSCGSTTVGVVGGGQQLQGPRANIAVRLWRVGHRPQVHPAVVDGQRAEHQVAGGELDGVGVDVESAEQVLDDVPVQVGPSTAPDPLVRSGP